MGNPNSLSRRIFEPAHLTGEFRLRSGQLSSEYFDKYRFEPDPVLLRELDAALAAALPIGVASQICGLPTLFVRKQEKGYGTCRLAEGGELDGKRLAIIEDVVTSGGQVIDSARELRNRGAAIVVVLCVIDREAGGAENLAK